jgi:hypothetical protein
MKLQSQSYANTPPPNIRQEEIPTAVVVGELGVIQVEQVQHRGVPIVDVHGVQRGFVANYIFAGQFASNDGLRSLISLSATLILANSGLLCSMHS